MNFFPTLSLKWQPDVYTCSLSMIFFFKKKSFCAINICRRHLFEKLRLSTFENDRSIRFLSSIVSNIELQTKLNLEVDLPPPPPSVPFLSTCDFNILFNIWGQFSRKFENLQRSNTMQRTHTRTCLLDLCFGLLLFSSVITFDTVAW